MSTKTEGLTVGIDLGTTNSAVAIMKDGKTIIIEGSQGNRTTPSCVAIGDKGKILVGKTATNQSATNPEGTIYGHKRLMGMQFDELNLNEWKPVYKIVKDSKTGDARIEVKKDGKTELWAPEKPASIVLKEMKEAAESYLGEKVTSAVVTVPAYFNEKQRQATKDAGEIAGLEIKRIINEPTAAALSYGLDKGNQEKKIVVYDLGGGTFDVSVIEISGSDEGQQFMVLATNGDTFLGGEDFDKRLLDYLVDEFKKSNGIDLSTDSLAFQRLKEAAEKAKIELSATQETEVNLPFITADATGPKHLQIKITRSKFEGLVEDLVERSLEPCRIAIEDSDLSLSEIDEVILVGGQTRMPLVREKVKNFFNKEPKKDINPDEAVALGAAAQAAVLSGTGGDILLLDVTPLSLGIETMGGIMTKLIEKNTTIPTRAQQVFSTAENNQTSVTIHVLQGERDRASSNKSLGRFDLANIPAAPRGMPQIEVTFDIDANGILNVSAKDKNTGKEHSIVIKSAGGLSDEDIEKMIRDSEQHADEDKKFKELVDCKNQADALINTAEKTLADIKDITDTEKQQVETAIEDLKSACKTSEDKSEIESKQEALSNLLQPIASRSQQQAAPEQNSETKDQADGTTMDAEFEEVNEDDKK